MSTYALDPEHDPNVAGGALLRLIAERHGEQLLDLPRAGDSPETLAIYLPSVRRLYVTLEAME
jgi:hypothetical protein